MKEISKLKDSPTECWIDFLKVMNQNSEIYQNVKPSERRFLHGHIGISGVNWGQTIGKTSVITELYIHGSNKEKNKFIVNELKKSQEEIEKRFGESIDWARLDNKIACRIRRKLENGEGFQGTFRKS